jgi:hypothetical protein
MSPLFALLLIAVAVVGPHDPGRVGHRLVERVLGLAGSVSGR